MINRGWLIALLLGFTAAPHASAEELGTMAELTAETLAGERIVLPKGLPKETRVFIIGFSRASSTSTREWSQQLQAQVPDSAGIFRALSLEGAPEFVRGMIVRGMKKDIPAAEHGRFLIVTENSAGWKQTGRLWGGRCGVRRCDDGVGTHSLAHERPADRSCAAGSCTPHHECVRVRGRKLTCADDERRPQFVSRST